MFLSNNRQNGWTDRAQILCRPSHVPGKVYRWSKFLNLSPTKFEFIKFWKSTKLYYKIYEFFLFLFKNLKKEKMFTTKIEEDVHEAPCIYKYMLAIVGQTAGPIGWHFFRELMSTLGDGLHRLKIQFHFKYFFYSRATPGTLASYYYDYSRRSRIPSACSSLDTRRFLRLGLWEYLRWVSSSSLRQHSSSHYQL